jgi:hypothetical protein
VEKIKKRLGCYKKGRRNMQNENKTNAQKRNKRSVIPKSSKNLLNVESSEKNKRGMEDYFEGNIGNTTIPLIF